MGYLEHLSFVSKSNKCCLRMKVLNNLKIHLITIMINISKNFPHSILAALTSNILLALMKILHIFIINVICSSDFNKSRTPKIKLLCHGMQKGGKKAVIKQFLWKKIFSLKSLLSGIFS